tara:strand:+ start:2038 stop:2721 length:684 start_codon:yes stop_codon:yes gene_type:complete
MKTNNVKVILQARTLSYRLWAKSLLPIGNMPLAALCAKRLGNTGYPVIVAIPSDKSDDALNTILKKNNLKVLRGSHKNVLDRYLKSSIRMKDNDLIVRATADNPFPDGQFVNEIIRIFHKFNRKYICTHQKFFNLPYGLAIQIFRAGDLRRVSKKRLSKNDKEHVVPGLARDKINTVYGNPITQYKKFFTTTKLSIDTIEDYLRVEKIFSKCKNPIKDKWYDIIKRK